MPKSKPPQISINEIKNAIPNAKKTKGATIVPTLHQKITDQATPATNRETQLRQQLIELQNDNARLRQYFLA